MEGKEDQEFIRNTLNFITKKESLKVKSQLINSLGINQKTKRKIEEEKERKRVIEKGKRQLKIANMVKTEDMIDHCKVCNCKLWGVTLEVFMKFHELSEEKARERLNISDDFPMHNIIYQDCPECSATKERKAKSDIKKSKEDRFGVFSKANINNPINENQETLFKTFKQNLVSSYFLSGKDKSGKSWSIYAMANELIRQDLVFQYHDFSGTKLTNAIYQYQKTGKSIFNSTFLSNLNPYREGENIYLLIWDGIDKIKFTEYIIKELLTIFDLFMNKGNRFQFMITSNKSFHEITDIIGNIEGGNYSQEAFKIGKKISDKCNFGKNIIEFK